jgi:glyoxylase-like metal-dependent hydrolase (beta-lactamase superfamily II)
VSARATAAGAAAGATYEVLAVRYGTRVTRRSDVFFDYGLYGEPDAELGMAYYFWVARNAERTVVVDTGFDPSVGARRGRAVVCPPLEALGRLGIEPRSVSLLVLTHLHYDHIGNVAAFEGVPIAAPERELAFWRSPIASRRHFAIHVERDELDRVQRLYEQGRVRALGPHEEVAPGITAVHIGGHTPGLQALVVASAAGPVVLASDAFHYYEELELDRPFAILCNLEEMYRGFDTLRELSAGAPELLVAGHDPLVMERYRPVAGEAAGLAVRIA